MESRTNVCVIINNLSIAFLIVAVVLFGCRGAVKKKNNAPPSALALHVGNDKYIRIDTKQSVVTWKGSSLNGLNAQNGFIYLSNGELMIENGQLTGGTVEVDMNTIEDRHHEKDNKLVNHLKDPDFFEVEKFPFSTIVITGVASLTDSTRKITGNLTIKGITHPVSFPAKIDVDTGMVIASAKLFIDRTKWDVRYKSAKFFKNLANQTMSDSIEFNIRVVAKNN